MTTLTKAVRRTLLDRDVVVEMTPQGIRMREKRRRSWYGPISWGRLFVQLARLEADAKIAARKAARRAT
jgi:hypothetical protein